ncbi:TJP2 [Cordylochernes scorpioides]|uniref:TJP2 n=1 Tax=Cordylochernes scorpioides TaxID=51811 RepID=A0ABY6LI86_9ARAC|nr:TJP2 [Cordylochernes scorpioides]
MKSLCFGQDMDEKQQVPGYGFGIAVCGGKDNAHGGDSPISVSDVLKSGPAEGKLHLPCPNSMVCRVNDHLVTINNIPLENVDYSMAVQLLRDCGPVVHLINGANTENLSLREARKILESCKEKLQLVIRKDDFSKFLNGTYFDISSKALSKGLVSRPDQRYITFHKEGSVGIRLTGGNEVGIFVTAVQPGSAASLQGLQPGDKLLKVGSSLHESRRLDVQDTLPARRWRERNRTQLQCGGSVPCDGHLLQRHLRLLAGLPAQSDPPVHPTWDHPQQDKVCAYTACFQSSLRQLWLRRAEECAQDQFNQAKKESNETGGGGSRVSFFRRRAARRSKSLNKENWEDIVFGELWQTQGKHAVLDIPPTAVDRLNYAQFYPIVIFLRAENKHTVKELLSRMPKSSSSKSTKKLYDQAVKLEKLWSHIFTAIITLSSADMWYKKVRETIDKQQGSQIWMSESKPKEAIGDDFLFPLSPSQRLSYASSPDLDLSPPRPTSPMMKASSDPSIATQEETVPHYRPVPRQMDGVYDFTSYGGGGGGPQYPSNLPRDRYSAVSGGYRPPPPHVPPKYTRLTDRPVPPPKPAGYMAQPKTWPPDDSLAPPPYSMDPRYDRPLPRPYPPRGHEPPPYSPTTSLIERGSAFELYKKPERAMYPK